MSNLSVTSSKREDRDKQYAERTQELEAIKALNSSLMVYLEHLKLISKNLIETNKNVEELCKVNKQWDSVLNITKDQSRS